MRAVRGTTGIAAGLLPLPHDPEGAVTALEAEILDVGAAGFADAQTVESEEESESCVVAVAPLGGEHEHTDAHPVGLR